MSQDELAIKFIIDPTQFREELSRLRRDLEDQYRIETDKFREEKREAYVPTPTEVEIRERTTGFDEGATDRIDDIAKDVEELKRGLGLPIPIGDQTIGGLRDLFQRALTELPGYAGMHRQDMQDVTDMLAVMEDRFGGGTGISQLKEEGYTPMVAVMRKLSDLLYYVGQASDTDRTLGIYSSIGNTIESFFRGVVQQFPGIPVGDLPGVGSKMSLGHAGLEELFSMLTEQEAVGKLGMREFRFKNQDEKLEGIIDFFARFQHESGMTGARGIEIATGKADEAKMDQVRRYIESTMRYIQREAGEEGSLGTFLEKLARDPEKYKGLARVTTVFTTAVQDFDQKLLETLTSGVGGETWEDILDTVLEVETLEVPKEMQLETGMKDITGMRPEEMRKHRAMNMLDWLMNEPEIFQKFVRAVNPLNISMDEFAGKLRNVVEVYKEELRESGQPVSLDDIMKGVTVRAKDLAREFEFPRYGERGALRVLGKYKERGVSGRPYKIGKGLEVAYAGLGEEVFAEYSTEAERDQVSRLVGAAPEQEARAEVEREERGYPRLTPDVAERMMAGEYVSPYDDPSIPVSAVAEARGEIGGEPPSRLDEARALIERSSVEMQRRLLAGDEAGAMRLSHGIGQLRITIDREEARQAAERPERPGFVTTGVPMEYDPGEYLTGMKKVAKGMGFRKWEHFTEIVEAKKRGKLHEFLQETVGTTLAVVGATLKRGEREGVFSEEQRISLSEMMAKTPQFWSLYGEAPEMDPITGKPEAISRNTFVNELIKQRIGPGNIVQMGKELGRILENPEVNAMLNQKDLTGLHTAAIQLKRAERATMDLEPAFGGALSYWT